MNYLKQLLILLLSYTSLQGMQQEYSRLIKATKNQALEKIRDLKEFINYTDRFDGTTPLLIAIEKGKEDVVNILLNLGANPNNPDNNLGISPLQEAINLWYESSLNMEQILITKANEK